MYVDQTLNENEAEKTDDEVVNDEVTDDVTNNEVHEEGSEENEDSFGLFKSNLLLHTSSP